MEKSNIFKSFCNSDNPILRILALHHAGGTYQTFSKWVEDIDIPLEIIAISLPGRLDTYKSPPINDFQDLYQRIIQELAWLFKWPYCIWGHSCGAVLGLSLCQQIQKNNYPLPLSLIISGHSYPHPAKIKSYAAFKQEEIWDEICKLNNSNLIGELTPALKQMIITCTKNDYQLTSTAPIDTKINLNTKIAVFYGEKDPVFNEHHIKSWENAHPSSLEYYKFPGSHFYYESNRALFFKRLSHYLISAIARVPIAKSIGAPSLNYPFTQDIYQLFLFQVKKQKNKIALSFRNYSYTFAELDQMTIALCKEIKAYKINKGDLCAIYMSPCIEYVICMLTCLRQGIVFANISIEDPEDVIIDQCNSLSPKIVFTCSDYKFLSKDSCHIVSAENLTINSDTNVTLSNLVNINIDDPAFCILSSGSTGKPKAIKCTQRSMINSYWYRYEHFPYAKDECELCYIFFIWEILRPLLAGVKTVILPKETLLNSNHLATLLIEKKISRVLFTPSIIAKLITHGNLHQYSKQLNNLKYIILNGEMITNKLVKDIRRVFLQASIINDYSISECHDICTSEIKESTNNDFIFVGPPINNVEIFILNNKKQLIPKAQTGNIYVGGFGLGNGYINDPIQQKERFVYINIHGEQKLLFNTGDRGRLMLDGSLQLLGRSAYMFKVRGFSIVPEKISAAICAIREVKQAHVMSYKESENSSDHKIAAFIVSARKKNSIEDIKSKLSKKLATHEIPNKFIMLDKIPTSSNHGKIDSQALIPLLKSSKNSNNDAIVKNSLFESIKKAWENLLQITDSIQANSNFFHLGGNSLLAIELAHWIEESLCISVSPTLLYEYPILSDFCRNINKDCPANLYKQNYANKDKKINNADIAIIGFSCAGPGFSSAGELWDILLNRVESLTNLDENILIANKIPASKFQNKKYVKRCGFLKNRSAFDYKFWKISYNEAQLMDPQQRLFIQESWKALEHAGYSGKNIPKSTGVYAGCAPPNYWLTNLCNWKSQDLSMQHLIEIGNDKDYIASKTAYLLNCTGPAVTVQTSCSTGLATIFSACDSLRLGHCNMAIAGSVSLEAAIEGYLYRENHILSPDGFCRPFDAGANGTVLSEGIGVIVLKRLADAINDNNIIYGVIKGYAINNDANRKSSYSSPSIQGQSDVIKQAMQMANVSPDNITFVEAHGTATYLGDPIECQALLQAYRQLGAVNNITVGSLKGNIGHTNFAAGALGLIKATLCLYNKTIVPTINFKSLNPEINSCITVQDTKKHIPSATDSFIGVSSFGIGGTNCHAVIQGYHTCDDRTPRRATSSNSQHIVYVFSGQGTQQYGMGREIYQTSEDAKNIIDKGCDYLKSVLPDFKYELLESKSKNTKILTLASYLQPAIILIEYALYFAWESNSFTPDFIIGHSLGEYAAAIVAGNMSLKTALHLTFNRGRIIDENHSDTGLLQVCMKNSELLEWLTTNNFDNVYIALENSQFNTVVGGEILTLKKISNKLKNIKIVSKFLTATCAYHTDHALPIAEKFSQFIKDKELKICNKNLINSLYASSSKGICLDKNYWYNHLTNKVRFKDCFSTFPKGKVIIVEFSPAKSLASIIKDNMQHRNYQYITARPISSNVLPDTTFHSIDIPVPQVRNLHDNIFCYQPYWESKNVSEITCVPTYISIDKLDNIFSNTRLSDKNELTFQIDSTLKSTAQAWIISTFLSNLCQHKNFNKKLIRCILPIKINSVSNAYANMVYSYSLVLNQEIPSCRLQVSFTNIDNKISSYNWNSTNDKNSMRFLQNNLVQTKRYNKTSLPNLSNNYYEEKIIVIIGGTGKIGQNLSRHLTQLGAICINLSRNPSQDKAKLNHYINSFAVDVADFNDLNNIINKIISTHKRIDHIIHAAGVAQLQPINLMNENHYKKEVNAKVYGTLNLYNVLENLPNDKNPYSVMLMSSLASILGGYHMAAYSAANAFLDSFIECTSVSKVKWMSINWDDWDFVYDKQQISNYNKSKEYNPIPTTNATNVLLTLLQSNMSQVLVSNKELEPRIGKWLGTSHIEKEAKNTDLTTFFNTNDIVLHAYKKILGIDSINNSTINFFDVGGDSILAAQLLDVLSTQFPKCKLTIGDIFSYPTISEITDHIDGCNKTFVKHELTYS